MKQKLHIPDHPTEDNIRPCLDALKYKGEITLNMIEDEAYEFLKRRFSRTLRRFGKHLRERFKGCVARIDYPDCAGSNGCIKITLNKPFDGVVVPVCQLYLRLSWRLDPMSEGRFEEAELRAMRQLLRKLRKQ